jgi:hypothetical protein
MHPPLDLKSSKPVRLSKPKIRIFPFGICFSQPKITGFVGYVWGTCRHAGEPIDIPPPCRPDFRLEVCVI